MLSSPQIEEQKDAYSTKLLTPPSDDTVYSRKRKPSDNLEKRTNPKLQEFLEVMQPPSKSKIWANEDAIGTGANNTPVVEAVEITHKDDVSEEDYEPVPKKRKQSPPTMSQLERDLPEQTTSRTAKTSEEPIPDTVSTNITEIKEPAERSEPTDVASSDADWLRSRTSRLLGLVDDDDDDSITSNPTALGGNDLDVTAVDQKLHESKRRTSDAGNQTDEMQLQDTTENDATQKNYPGVETEKLLSTGRLFVRNLSYGASEDNLKAYFNSCGILSEVGTLAVMLINRP